MSEKMPNSRRNLDIAIGSERAHDMIDLQVIAHNENIDFSQTKIACTRLFASRKQQSWPPVITKGPEWNTLYEAQISGLNVIQDIDEAVAWVNNLVRSINDASV